MIEASIAPVWHERWSQRKSPLTHTAFSRTLTVPDTEDEHGRQEPYDPRSHPGQWHVLQALDGIVNGEPAPRRWRRFMFLTDAQGGGKSWLLQQIVLHGTIELGQGVIWALPTRGMAGDMWNLKLRPAWEGSGLGAFLPTTGPGARGASAPRSVRTNHLDGRGGGTVAFMSSGGRGQSGQAGLTAKRLIVDELGDWDPASFTRIRKRISRWNDISIEAYGSTIKNDLNDLALETCHGGTDARLSYVCPHCGEWTQLTWKTWVGGDDPHAACAANACVIREQDRRAMFARHRVELKNSDSDLFSITMTALDCPWKSLAWLAREEARAKDAEQMDREPMRTFYHDERVETYSEEDPDVPSHAELQLAARAASEAYERPVKPNRPKLPDGTKVVTIGADTGKREAWWLALAMDVQLRWWILDWSVKTTQNARGEPTPAEQTEMLERLNDRMRSVGMANAIGIDVGYNTDLVVPWARKKGIKLMRGDTRPNGKKDEDRNSPLPSWAEDRRQDDGSHWIFIDGAEVKKEISRALARKPGEPGAGHIPRGQSADDWLIRHLTAEVWDQEEQVWVKKRRDNHLLDCLVYAWALAVIGLNRPKAQSRQYGVLGKIG